MTLTPSDRDALRALADKATQPGPWTRKTVRRETCVEYSVLDANGFWVAGVGAAPHDAAFIAAMSPDVTLRLLDALDAVEKERDEAYENGHKVGERVGLQCSEHLAILERDAALAECERLRAELANAKSAHGMLTGVLHDRLVAVTERQTAEAIAAWLDEIDEDGVPLPTLAGLIRSGAYRKERG